MSEIDTDQPAQPRKPRRPVMRPRRVRDTQPVQGAVAAHRQIGAAGTVRFADWAMI